ncbi:MAG: histidine kinase [Actinomycetia bacterium]|nr:histidine kinase [Actinomycetes bacterium]
MRRLNPVPWLRAHPFAADALLAGALLVLSLLSLLATAPKGIDYRGDDALLWFLIILSTAPVAWRRKAPFDVLVVTGVSSVLVESLHYFVGVGGLGVLVALYSVAAHTTERRRSIFGLALALVGVTIVYASAAAGFELGGLISNYVLFSTAWILGDNLQTRRAYVRALEERAVLSEAAMREEARQAVTAERTRIARELHDVVAHSVSVMVVQAGAARRVLDKEPARASEAMASIESTGRQSLNELRRLLGMLRQADGEATGRVPQPTIEHVDTLLDQTRDAGLPVTLEIEGVPRPLAPGVDLSAYRIVQEALTNAIKHAGPAHAEVRLCYGADTLEVIVSDDGRGADCEEDERNGTAGHGIVGMQERVSLFGGQLHVGNRPGGGFTVRATLPLEVNA